MKRSSAQRVVARYLSAAPLDEYYSYPSPTGASKSVGWGREKSKPFLRAVTTYFEAREDSWAIIVLPKNVKLQRLDDYVESNPKLKRCKIIAVGSEAQEGDETAPKWVVLHDIIGHSIDQQTEITMSEHWANAQSLHAALPRKFRITTDPLDVLPDIYAAIFLNADLKNLVENATKIGLRRDFEKGFITQQLYDREFKSLGKLFNILQEDVARWAAGFKLGVPKLAELW
jgi:hypothetical protein